MSEFDIPEFWLENVRCYTCKEYLSHPPIRLLRNGNSVCGSCPKSIKGRNFTLENLLSNFKFPCKFKRNGCSEMLLFGQTKQHEDDCKYSLYICPALSFCAWQGPTHKFSAHFAKDHSELVSNKSEFKVKPLEDTKGRLIISVGEGTTVIFKYEYTSSNNNFQYDIRHFNSDNAELSLKISLINNLEPDCNVNLKSDIFYAFDKSFYLDFKQMSDIKVLNLNKYLSVLDNPNCILFRLYIDSKEEIPPLQLLDSNFNEKLIEQFRCKQCKGYLLPPLYKMDNQIVCWYCAIKHVLNDDCCTEKLSNKVAETVSKTNFPCRWFNCDVIKPGLDLPRHELTCSMRKVECNDCRATIAMNEYISHIKNNHEYVHVKNTFSYEIHTDNRLLRIYTSKDDSIVVIKCVITYDYVATFTGCQLYVLFNSSDEKFHVQFEHDHCKIKSEIFTIKPITNNNYISWKPERWIFSKSNFPTCFKNSKMVVNIRF